MFSSDIDGSGDCQGAGDTAMNLIRALVATYIHKLQVVLLFAGGIMIAATGGGILSKLIVWILGLRPSTIDSLLPVCFLLVAVGLGYAYLRYLRWRFFKDLTK
jgi:hypothetical protein